MGGIVGGRVVCERYDFSTELFDDADNVCDRDTDRKRMRPRHRPRTNATATDRPTPTFDPGQRGRSPRWPLFSLMSPSLMGLQGRESPSLSFVVINTDCSTFARCPLPAAMPVVRPLNLATRLAGLCALAGAGGACMLAIYCCPWAIDIVVVSCC